MQRRLRSRVCKTFEGVGRNGVIAVLETAKKPWRPEGFAETAEKPCLEILRGNGRNGVIAVLENSKEAMEAGRICRDGLRSRVWKFFEGMGVMA